MTASQDFLPSSPITQEALGQSEAFLDFQERLSRVAPIDRPVLLLGERGTGKELAATRLHFLSRRWQGPFVTLNCSSLAPSLVEAELFGHEKGAFTGADKRRTGRFEAAHNGTLFLDEIGAIPMEAQEKILRAVEYGSFERVGSSTPIEVDVRIISATNADLTRECETGRFKPDLLDRLSFEVLFLPPLRNRSGDILLLANHFARRMAHELGRDTLPVFSKEAAGALETHPWNGNVRELKNVVERAVYRSRDRRVKDIVFNPFVSPYGEPAAPAGPSRKTPETPETPESEEGFPDFTAMPLKSAVATLEILLVRRALSLSRHNQRRAAGLLGLSYDQLRGIIRKHGEKLR
ncbi:MAG: phage shock protein operon transcriptional activator [Desulfobacteraceae bacterium]|nr:phage shock protein operon transcriptional activator [Desulfobacteraceae bacterium]